jgi:hypothetical protein
MTIVLQASVSSFMKWALNPPSIRVFILSFCALALWSGQCRAGQDQQDSFLFSLLLFYCAAGGLAMPTPHLLGLKLSATPAESEQPAPSLGLEDH